MGINGIRPYQPPLQPPIKPDWGAVGERLYKARKKAKLSKEVAAEKIGISTTLLERFELGPEYINQNYLDSMARVYDLSVNYLLWGDRP